MHVEYASYNIRLSCITQINSEIISKNKKKFEQNKSTIKMFGILLVIQGLVFVTAFPDGAPSDTCVKARANQPNHGASRTQAIHTLPYDVRATTDTYNPGQQVQGLANYINSNLSNQTKIYCE